MTAKILVVDDDPLICKGLKFNLEQEGYEIETSTNSPDAIKKIEGRKYQLAILDIGLPGDDGLSLCRYIKAHQTIPVLFLTARRRDLDEIVGLEIGADDYITKPFNLDVLKAHVKVLLRRERSLSYKSKTEPSRIKVKGFVLEPAFHTMSHDGSMIELSPLEFNIMELFLSNPNRVFGVEEIIDRVWGQDFIGETQVLYVQIHSLREKVETDPKKPKHLVTLRGVGYKFRP